MVGSNFVVAPAPKPSKAGRRDTSCRKQTTFLHASTLSPFLRLLQLYGHRLTRSDPLREPALNDCHFIFQDNIRDGIPVRLFSMQRILYYKTKTYPTPSHKIPRAIEHTCAHTKARAQCKCSRYIYHNHSVKLRHLCNLTHKRRKIHT